MESDSKDIQIEITIPQIKTDMPKKTTVFEITIKWNGKTTIISKPYKEFKMLLYQLKKSCNELRDFKLPYRRFFSTKNDAEIIQERKEALVNLIKILVKIPNITENEIFLSFFNLNPVHTLSSASLVPTESNMFIDQNQQDSGSSVESHHKANVTDFEIYKVIGKGNYGRVYLVRHKADQKFFAMKVLEKRNFASEGLFKQIMEERNVLMKSVNHPFLIKLYYSFQTSEKLYLILEYVNGGELFYHLQQEGMFPESRAKFYAAEIGDAIGYLHNHNIIYRDLKPENILLDSQGHIALTDFGLSKELKNSQDKTSTFCGTPEYLAPEIINKKPYDKTVDWWCFGCVLYEMINGMPPFYSKDSSEMYNNILNNEVQILIKCSIPCRSIINELLNKDPQNRLGHGPNDWKDVMENYFFKDIKWDDLLAKKVKPPYNPNVSNELDLKNIDQEFLGQEVTDSIMFQQDNPLADTQKEKNKFVGFTFVHGSEFD